LLIYIGENQILDTENEYTKKGTNAVCDKNCDGKTIIFKIEEISPAEKLCSVCRLKDGKGMILTNVPYEKAINSVKSKNIPYEEIVEKVQPKGKTFKGIKVSTQDDYIKSLKDKVDKSLDKSKIDVQSAFSEDLSKEQRNAIYNQNISQEVKSNPRFINTLELSFEKTPIDRKAEDLILRAKSIIKKKYLFYYLILSELTTRFDDKRCKTLGVSPGFLFVNSEFALQRTVKEMVFILCHEAGHIVFKHHARIRKRNSQLWNIAGDLIINKTLSLDLQCTPSKEGPDAEFAHGGLYISTIDIEKETTETIYNRLVQQNPNFNSNMNGDGDSSENGQDGDSNQDSNGNNDSQDENQDQNSKSQKGKGKGKKTITLDGHTIEIGEADLEDIKEDSESINRKDESVEQRIKDSVEKALRKFSQSKEHGDGCGNIARLFELWNQPEPVGWVEKLKPFLRESLNMSATYTKAHQNRITRFTGYKAIMPGAVREKNKLKNLLLAIDTSGSIDDDNLNLFYNQTHTLLTQFQNGVEGIVCYWDTEVASWGKFKDFNQFKKVEAKGFGGTDIKKTLEFAVKQKIDYLVVYTDGYFDMPDKSWAKKFKYVIWVLYNESYYRSFNAPFGVKCIAKKGDE